MELRYLVRVNQYLYLTAAGTLAQSPRQARAFEQPERAAELSAAYPGSYVVSISKNDLEE